MLIVLFVGLEEMDGWEVNEDLLFLKLRLGARISLLIFFREVQK